MVVFKKFSVIKFAKRCFDSIYRLLKGLGAPKNARIYWAGGQPLGGKEALLPLIQK